MTSTCWTGEVPAREDRYITFDQYISGYLRRIVHRVRRFSGEERIGLLGYSLGGTMTAIFTALHGRFVNSLVQLVAPINFHDQGLLSQWTRKGRFDADLVVDTLGAMPVDLMRASFRMLKPTTQIVQKIALATRLGDAQALQDFMALQNWISDDMPYLGEAYRKYIKDCYQENYLVQGKLIIEGERVDLGRIDCPLLTDYRRRRSPLPARFCRRTERPGIQQGQTIVADPGRAHSRDCRAKCPSDMCGPPWRNGYSPICNPNAPSSILYFARVILSAGTCQLAGAGGD